MHAFLGDRLAFMGIPEVIERTLERIPAARVHSFDTLYDADAEARAVAGRGGRGGGGLSLLLAFLGFAVLIVLHEAGHFAAAKAVGMRVERFALFFPPLIARRQKGGDRVRRRRDPARRLREDHRHEPGGGDPAGARPPRVLPQARVEAGGGHRGGPRGQHRPRLPDPDGPDLGQRDARAARARLRRRARPPRGRRAGDGRRARRGRRRKLAGTTWASRPWRRPSASPPTAARGRRPRAARPPRR